VSPFDGPAPLGDTLELEGERRPADATEVDVDGLEVGESQLAGSPRRWQGADRMSLLNA
jgi:hypothetical protein